ncbi:hypothetical protein H3Z83_12530 [Tenacibaculum sp. S7007]|uniref:Uncharacterized protein n=1 Tax=Tenacibaculum pelagium TaxID=2759527 RepID=A0A839AS83_9FLAO|nr:hypothetical protein [Tenacibaculum pelagium]MBA6157336.1 hypothetical protein [Tenacibaculum pelagium]
MRIIKKGLLVLTLSSILMAMQCDKKEIVETHTIELPNLVKIEKNTTKFLVGDYIIINTSIPNKLTTNDGENIYITDSFGANTEDHFVSYEVKLYKFSDKGQILESNIEDVKIIDGDAVFFDNYPKLFLKNYYKTNIDSLVSKIGIKLSEPGTYFLKGIYSNNKNKKQNVFITSLTEPDLEQVTIFTSIVNTGSEGFYKFTVE